MDEKGRHEVIRGPAAPALGIDIALGDKPVDMVGPGLDQAAQWSFVAIANVDGDVNPKWPLGLVPPA